MRLILIMVTTVILFSFNSAAFAAEFLGLGDLPGGNVFSNANDVSGDGTTVVGVSFSLDGQEAFRWTRSGGMVGLGDLEGGDFQSSATGVSADGAVVTGTGVTEELNDDGVNVDAPEAFRWTESGGMQGLDDLPGFVPDSRGFGISDDGSVIVGRSDGISGDTAIKWTSAGGMVDIDPGTGGHANAASQDGSVIVGRSGFGPFGTLGWVLDQDGFQRIGDLPGGRDNSEAHAVTPDGSVVVGQGETDFSGGSPDTSADNESSYEAARWTETSGLAGLGHLAGGDDKSRAYDVSADGSKIVGQGHTENGFEAFMWNSAEGMRLVQDILETDHGLDLAGWTLRIADAVSNDGTVITGTGINPLGRTEAWVADLDADNQVPVPAAVWLLGSGLIGLAGLRKRFAR